MSLILKINNKRVDFFNDFALNLTHDSITSTFGFNMKFDPENPDHKSIVRPFSYPSVTLEHEGNLVLTGVIVFNNYKQSKIKQMVSFSGYSKTGVLEDCQIPTSLYPLQSDGLTLKQIATKLIAPFNIEMVIDPSVESRMNKRFKTTTAGDSQTIKEYLSELASQKNIIISNDELGRLLFTEVTSVKTPIIHYDLAGGQITGTTFNLTADAQAMHSQITVQKQADIDGGNAGEFTIKNPFVTEFRPRVMRQTSGDDNDTELAAKRALSNELRSIPLEITSSKWDINSALIKPNNIIAVTSPELYLYNKTNFFIESVNFEGNTQSMTATINCVLPEVYTNQTPVNIFL